MRRRGACTVALLVVGVAACSGPRRDEIAAAIARYGPGTAKLPRDIVTIDWAKALEARFVEVRRPQRGEDATEYYARVDNDFLLVPIELLKSDAVVSPFSRLGVGHALARKEPGRAHGEVVILPEAIEVTIEKMTLDPDKTRLTAEFSWRATPVRALAACQCLREPPPEHRGGRATLVRRNEAWSVLEATW